MKKINMTEGSITKAILLFTVPLIIGQIFQLLYNTVDTAIVGQFCGASSVNSVGAATPVFNVLSFLIIGLTNGMNILMSEFYGAGRKDTLKKEIAVCLDFMIAVMLILSATCIIIAPYILQVMQVRSDLMEEAVIYLRITTAGLVFSGIYNVYNAALRSVGDAIRPLYFLIISCVFNILFDFIFVYFFQWGVAGVAWSTTLAQFLSMFICIFYGYRTSEMFHFSIQDFKMDYHLLKYTLSYALASAMQQIVLQVGKAFIQVNINALPNGEQAGYNIGIKVDDYVITPAICIGNSAAVFLAQNRGAGKIDRFKKGFYEGVIMEAIYTIAIAIVIFFTKQYLIQIFLSQDDPYFTEALTSGVSYLSVMCMLYLFPGLTNGVQSYFRGLGKLTIVFLSSFVQILARVIMSYILIPSFGSAGAAWCTCVGWTIMLLFEVPILIYHIVTGKGLHHVTDADIHKE